MKTGLFLKEELGDNEVEFCVVSDIHIANDDSNVARTLTDGRNDYVFARNRTISPISAEAYTLKRFCEKLKYSGDVGHFDDDKHVLVLLGDVINGECGYFASYNSVAYRLLVSVMSSFMAKGNIVYVNGNHDKNAAFYCSITQFPKKFIMENYERCGVRFEHGHRFDCLCNGEDFLGLMGDFASAAAVKLLSPNVEDLVRMREYYHQHSDSNSVRQKIETQNEVPNDWSLENKRVANGALNWLKSRTDLHTIVCGHTHQSPTHIKAAGLNYINSGKFVRDIGVNFVCRKDADDKWSLTEVFSHRNVVSSKRDLEFYE